MLRDCAEPAPVSVASPDVPETLWFTGCSGFGADRFAGFVFFFVLRDGVGAVEGAALARAADIPVG